MGIKFFKHKKNGNKVYVIKREGDLLRLRYTRSNYTAWVTVDYFHETFKELKNP